MVASARRTSGRFGALRESSFLWRASRQSGDETESGCWGERVVTGDPRVMLAAHDTVSRVEKEMGRRQKAPFALWPTLKKNAILIHCSVT